MDTSQMRVTMCEKAEELQTLWKLGVGDWFYKRDGIGYGLWLVCKVQDGSLWCSGSRMNTAPFDGNLVQFIAPENYIWLPCQDQLQKMVLSKYEFNWELAEIFGNQASKLLSANPSMDQLWLAFVMKEKYNKVWDGGDWIGVVKQRSAGEH